MTIAIIGASSFLAQALLRTLYHDHELWLYGRNAPYRLYHFPEHPLDYAALMDCSVIFYCAGAGIQPKHNDSVASMYELNAFEPIRLLQALHKRQYTGKVVTFGSYFELGNVTGEQQPFDEPAFLTQQHRLPNDYCLSKRLLSQYIYHSLLQNKWAFTVQHFILTNIYGVGENPHRLIPYIVQSALSGQPLRFTSGHQKRQYTHVDDLARFLATQLHTANAGIFHLTQPDVVSVRELVEKVLHAIQQETGLEAIPEFGSEQKRDESMAFLAINPQRAQTELGFAPTISLEQGILEYIAYYGTNR